MSIKTTLEQRIKGLSEMGTVKTGRGPKHQVITKQRLGERDKNISRNL
jgi:hypothetical protein